MVSVLRVYLVLVASCLLGGCLFPSLDGLSKDYLVTSDANAPDTGDADAVNADCPDASDPTLQAYYRLNGSLADCSSFGRPAMVVGTAGTWTTGKLGGALLVSSDDVGVSGPGSGCIDVQGFPNITGALTVTAWVRVDKAPAPDSPGFIVAKSADLNTEGWRMSTNQAQSNFTFTLGGIGDAGLDQLGSMTSYAPGVWTYVTMVFDPSSRDSIYINGELDTNSTTTSPAASTSAMADLRIGCRGDETPVATTYFDGAIEEVRIYSRALAASEISALYSETP
jgi:hypothetical protein